MLCCQSQGLEIFAKYLMWGTSFGVLLHAVNIDERIPVVILRSVNALMVSVESFIALIAPA